MQKEILKDEFIDLKPCPFCGSFADFGDRRTKGIIIMEVGCTNPCCFCQKVNKIKDDRALHKVIKMFRQDVVRWNDRAEESKRW